MMDNRYVTVESLYNEPCDITDNVKTNRLSDNIVLSYRTLNYSHSAVSVTFHVLSVTRDVRNTCSMCRVTRVVSNT